MKRIDALTDEQRAAMPGWAAKWIAIGLSTERADRPMFERAVAECYRAANLEPPKRVVWATSPLATVLAGPIASRILANGASVDDSEGASVRDSVDAIVRDSVYANVGASVRDSVDVSVLASVYAIVGANVRGSVNDSADAIVGASVGASVNASVNASVVASVGASVRASVGASVVASVNASVVASVDDSVYDSVGASVRASVNASVGASVGAEWSKYMGGQFWVGGWWGAPSLVSFFTEICGLELPADKARAAKAYAETCSSACWWWPHRDFVVVSERPTKILRDGAGRLHSLDGKAIEWPDGYGVYSVRGTMVPAEWIEHRDRLTANIALTWENIEQRRAAAEILGWDRILAELHPRTIDEDKDPSIGTLLEVDLPDAPNERFLKVRCGTGRTFVLPVPRACNTALAANAWTYDIEPSELRSMEVRT